MLVAFTGNNIAFVKDLASRVVVLRLNAKTADPLRRQFKHRDVLEWARAHRARALSALIAIARAGEAAEIVAGSRFADFDAFIARPVRVVTGHDIRGLLETDSNTDSAFDESAAAALALIAQWQREWRGAANGDRWRTSELVDAVEQKVFDDAGIKCLRRWVDNGKLWESNPAQALGYALRNVAGDHKFEPLVLEGRVDRKSNVKVWSVESTAPADQFPTKSAKF